MHGSQNPVAVERDAARSFGIGTPECRIERELGTGGMAGVHLGDGLEHDRKVARKS